MSVHVFVVYVKQNKTKESIKYLYNKNIKKLVFLLCSFRPVGYNGVGRINKQRFSSDNKVVSQGDGTQCCRRATWCIGGNTRGLD